MLYNAAKLTDTWQKPNIMDGINTTADMIKSGAAENPANSDQVLNESVAMFQQFLGCLPEAISSDFDEAIGVDALVDAKKSGRGNIQWKRLAYIAKQHGWPMDDKDTLWLMKERLTMNSQYQVNLADLAKWFDIGEQGAFRS